MTSSFSNLVGTERDRKVTYRLVTTPLLKLTWKRPSTNNDESAKDLERFYKELGEIEALKSKTLMTI